MQVGTSNGNGEGRRVRYVGRRQNGGYVIGRRVIESPGDLEVWIRQAFKAGWLSLRVVDVESGRVVGGITYDVEGYRVWWCE